MSGTAEVLVIGGGVIAKSTALALGKAGKSVVVFAPSALVGRSASRASGAMLGAFAEYTKDKFDLADRYEGELRVRAGRVWEDWFEGFVGGTEREGSVHRGTFIVASNNGLMDLENIEFIKAQADELGEPSDWVDSRDVPGLEPHRLSRPQKVLSLPNEGYVDSGLVLDALDAALAVHPKISLVDDTVQSVTFDDTRPEVLTRGGERYAGEDVVIAAGVETGNLLAQLEIPEQIGAPTVLGGRGVSLVISSDQVFGGVMRTPNRDFACGSHVVPLGGGRTYLGATNRLETEDFGVPLPTIGELHSLCHSLSNEINVHLRTARVLQSRAGYRPISSDGYPIFGRTAHPNVYVATGTYRNGMLMAPVIADLVSSEITGEATDYVNPFTPLDRAHLFSDRDTNAAMVASLRQVVSFMQEPDGNLPFDRAAELENLLAAFLKAAIGLEGGSEVVRLFGEVTERYPISEAMPILMYRINER